jgi:hypothetical protein
MKHWKKYHCHSDYGRPHRISEKGKRVRLIDSDLNAGVGKWANYPDTAVGDYVVYVECDRCGRGAKINKDGYVLERHGGF